MRIEWAWIVGGQLAVGLLLAHCSSNGNGTPSPQPDSGSTVEAGSPDTGAAETGPIADSGSDGACPAVTSDAGTNTYAPDDPNIQYSGRVDLTDPKKPKFAASSVYIRTKFHGTSVAVSLQDDESGPNYFDVYVDNFPPVKVDATGKHDATPPGLCDGDHTVLLVKRTEASTGATTFLGFTFNGTIEMPDAKPMRKIEIIGDSITCGAGVEAKSATDPQCMQDGVLNLGTPEFGYGQGVENGYLAYGSDLARELNAEWQVTCVSGIGLTRNYYNLTVGPMPKVYDLMYPGDQSATPTTWPTAQFKPDVIVMGLGTNDFSRDSPPGPDGGVVYRDPIDPTTLEQQGYIPFIDQLATYYPGVTVVLVSSPILGDMYPTSTDMQLTQHQQVIQDVAAYYGPDGGSAATDGGAPNVRVFAAIIPKVIGTGCGGHPSVKQQQEAGADEIAPVIRSAMNW